MTAVLILPSPLLPGMVYRPLVEALAAEGVRAELASVPKDPSAPTLVEQWRAKSAGFDVLAPHSNAGLMAPLVAGRASGSCSWTRRFPRRRGPSRWPTGG
ncbi:hypothetical protein BW730_12020 [Tessaracoccus aquimaris]|uniref:Glycosyltransferase subfamily 4-like N-terminal domain-containing protein n=1 Tax=Tessaracoccus aquimaris TaxID=1332264 RepID=A0A1Q2CPZ8_9ACTN|nr:hypothetical protein [Tessaracoccus aquimaris]AQP48110.1 hypothetical protein BW730_12020 [Tessaracoccus aquimaris]